jgi:two-component system invasion response regulator UvrY
VPASITVLTVDDDAAARQSTRGLVAAAPGFRSVGEVASGEEAIEALVELGPDLVIVDTDMPGLDGYETSRRLVAARPHTTVILVHADGEPPAQEAIESSRAAATIARAALTPSTLQGLWRERGVG